MFLLLCVPQCGAALLLNFGCSGRGCQKRWQGPVIWGHRGVGKRAVNGWFIARHREAIRMLRKRHGCLRGVKEGRQGFAGKE
jgi:hypothetical protein